MADNTKFGSSMQQMFEGMDKALGTKSVMGEAMDLGGGKYVIPLADVTFGMGAGASVNEKYNSNRGGGGVSAKMTPHAVLLIENGTARMTEASCPDHVCIDMGVIRYTGQSIVCLPNRLVVTVRGVAGEADLYIG